MKVPLKKGQVTKENTKFGLFENQEDNCFIFLFFLKKDKEKNPIVTAERKPECFKELT